MNDLVRDKCSVAYSCAADDDDDKVDCLFMGVLQTNYVSRRIILNLIRNPFASVVQVVVYHAFASFPGILSSFLASWTCSNKRKPSFIKNSDTARFCFIRIVPTVLRKKIAYCRARLISFLKLSRWIS